MFKTWGKIIWGEFQKIIISIWNKEQLPEEWKESIFVPIYKKGEKTDCSSYRGISILTTTYKLLSNNLLSKSTPYEEEINVDFDATDQLLIIYSAFVKYLKKWEYIKAMDHLCMDFKKAYDSFRREVLYNIFIEFGIPLKLTKKI
jgi:chorismate mutase